MTSSAVAYVLARAAEEGIEEAVLAAAAPFDPLLRGAVRRRAKRAIAAARSATRVSDERHVLRVAFLRAAGAANDAAPDDEAAVAQAFDAVRRRFPKRRRAFWPASAAVGALVALAAVAVAVAAWLPSRRDRFARSPVGVALGEGLTEFVVGVARHDADRREKGRAMLLARGVRSQAGSRAYDALDDALRRTAELAAAATDDEARPRRERLHAALRDLERELGRANVPAFVDEHDDEDMGGARRTWLFGYYAERRADVTLGGDAFVSLWGRRLDALNLDAGGVAYESAALGATVVALDEIDRWVARRVVPGLAKSAALPLGAEPAEELSGRGRVERALGERLRAELLPSTDLAQDDATELRDLLAARHAAFGRLAALGHEYSEPPGLRLPDKMRRSLSQRGDEVDAREILHLDDRLARGALLRGFEALGLAQAAVFELGALCSARASRRGVAAAMGSLEAAAGRDKLPFRESAAIAGWLCVLAGGEPAALALATVARHSAPDGSADLALYAVEAELGSAPTWLRAGRLVDRDDATRALEDALKQPAAAVRRAAAAAHGKLLAEPPPSALRKPRQ